MNVFDGTARTNSHDQGKTTVEPVIAHSQESSQIRPICSVEIIAQENSSCNQNM